MNLWWACTIHVINPLNAELNLVCHLLVLLGAHHILHVSRVRFNLHEATEKTAHTADGTDHQVLITTNKSICSATMEVCQ
jgi:hypothetical protein